MWNDKELKILRNNYKTHPIDEVVKLLPKRTKKSIQIKASREGLTIRHKDGDARYDDSRFFLESVDEKDRGYLGGIIDGEGCISFTRSKSSSGRFIYRMQVSIVNTSIQLKKWIDSIFPGDGYTRHWRRDYNTREVWSWTISGPKKTMKFLKEIAPYLIIKKQQARLLMSGYKHLNDEDRGVLFCKMRDLKHAN